MEHINLLNFHFEQNKDWDKEYIENMARLLKVSRDKVYKWHWEKKNQKKSVNKQIEDDIILNQALGLKSGEMYLDWANP